MWQNGEVSVINILTNTVSMSKFVLPLNVVEVVKRINELVESCNKN